MNEILQNRKNNHRQRTRRLLSGLNTLAALILLAMLLAMINYLSFRHYHRWDWSASEYYSLSDKTRSLLADLTNTVDIIVFFQPGQEIFTDVENLLKEYEHASRHVHVEWVDPDRDLARTEALARQYDVEQANVVVFDSGGRSKYVTAEDIMEYDYSPMQYGQRPQKIAFNGENAFSSAIQSIVQHRRPVVYFLQGHGEGAIDDHDRRTGYSQLAREIRRDNIDVKTLTFGPDHAVPQDCDVLIVLGPEKRLSVPECDLLSDYLQQNVRLMVLIDAFTDTGIARLLQEWGVHLADDLVVDASRTLTGRELFVTEYGTHPIVEHMEGITSIFYLPRSVEPVADETETQAAVDRPHVTPLAFSSEAGWAETDLEASVAEFEPGADRPGPIPIAAAIEKGPVPGIDVRIRPTRLVVFGDSDFIANGALAGGGMDLFMSALNWLLERDAAIGIAPRPFIEAKLLINKQQINRLFWMAVCGLPGIVALLGGLVWLRRRG